MILEIGSTDISDIETFPLLWRWNQASHTILPKEQIKRIEPFTVKKALELYGLVKQLEGKNIDSESMVIDTSGERKVIIEWLNKLNCKEEPVFISWNKDIAAKVPWHLFVDRWDDFCYPSSDDVDIVPMSGNWHLRYRHFEQFSWSKLNAI